MAQYLEIEVNKQTGWVVHKTLLTKLVPVLVYIPKYLTILWNSCCSIRTQLYVKWTKCHFTCTEESLIMINGNLIKYELRLQCVQQ